MLFICAIISSKVIGLIDTKPVQLRYKKGSFRLRLNPDAVRTLSKNLLWIYWLLFLFYGNIIHSGQNVLINGSDKLLCKENDWTEQSTMLDELLFVQRCEVELWILADAIKKATSVKMMEKENWRINSNYSLYHLIFQAKRCFCYSLGNQWKCSHTDDFSADGGNRMNAQDECTGVCCVLRFRQMY